MMWKEKVFSDYQNNYNKIFNLIYPAKNSTGFPERNLSVNFAKSYEGSFINSVVWYELQFGVKNNNHIDCVIIDKESKRILFIESKRFSKPKKKIEEMKKDIDRIVEVKKELLKDKRISDIAEYSFFGLILADVWLEGSRKNEIYNEFKEKEFIQKEYPEIELKSLLYDIREFEIQNVRNYKLVSFLWEL